VIAETASGAARVLSEAGASVFSLPFLSIERARASVWDRRKASMTWFASGDGPNPKARFSGPEVTPHPLSPGAGPTPGRRVEGGHSTS
jgi:hypothetical protein